MDVYATKLPFTDVPEKSWYHDDVKSAYEAGLINGKKPNIYAPDDNMTAEEAVKLAAAMHQLKNEGKVKFSSSKPWYKVYVDYAKQKSLITDDLAWNKNITRAGYMQIFAQILTDEESKKNEVSDGSIPDVPMTHPNAQAIYKLYRAGIVTGIDDKKNCSPGSNIKRSEVAAILVRMMDVKRRIGFSLGDGKTPEKGKTPGGGATPPPATTNSLKITKQPTGVKGAVGVTFILDVKVEGGKTPYNYQWEERKVGGRNYTKSSARGSDTNVLSPNVKNDAYDYRCVIKDANGAKVISADARVEKEVIASSLKITKHPLSIKGKEGNIVTLEVKVEGGKKPYSYQWERRGRRELSFTKSTAAGNTTDVLTPQIEALSYFYRCVITDANGDKVTSNEALVKKDTGVISLKITKQPESVKGALSTTAPLEVQVEGGKPPYSYQWEERRVGDPAYVNSTAIGNTTNILKPNVITVSMEYRCVIKDADGNEVTSNPASVILDPDTVPLVIAKDPKDIKGRRGEKVELFVIALAGKKPYNYQWEERKDGEADFKNSTAEGNTTDVLKPTVEDDIKFYRCVVTDARGDKETSNEAKVEVDVPQITKEPTDVKGNVGEFVTLEVQVEGGVKPYSYQWYYLKSGSPDNIKSTAEGNTTNTLKVRIENETYSYYCVIMDADGYGVTSKPVFVEKIAP
ncbi:hypothetical protein HMPREF0379_1502 [[Eubacterium] yurii subsp. margaretiae ATCC 43715]|nr:hypothetical protein HMPREF0379_1502 [[Eubacterium] yurii subsp. margaretiae ATCC 43715]